MKYEASPQGEQARDGWTEQLPCSFCGTLAKRAELAQYGARCARCYRHWCAAAFADPYTAPSHKRRPSPAEALEALRTWPERYGRPLNAAQEFQKRALERMLAPATTDDEP